MLDQKHLDELHASGISDATIAAAGIESVDGGAVRQMLGWQPKGAPWGRAWAIPFRSNGESNATYFRVKLDFPRQTEGGEVFKYESPLHAPNRVYFPPGFWQATAEPATPILVTEGEKKALCAMERGFVTISLVGVWGFTTKRARRATGRATGPRFLVDDLNRLHWHGRRVYICFDSDVADKPQVRTAEDSFAGIVAGRGADVRIVRLPKLGEGKTGLDDFLVYYGEQGPARLRELLESAQPAKPIQVTAADTAPMVLADRYISEQLAHQDTPRARHWRDEFHLWVGDHYATVATGDFSKRVLTWLDKVADKATPRLAHDVCECIAARLLVTADHERPLWLGKSGGPAEPADWLAMQNGILDLPAVLDGRKDVLRPHSALWFCANVLPFDYDAAAECPNWFTFLQQIFEDDVERISLLAEWFGYCLTPDTRQHAIMLLTGPRRSGKGTTLRMLRRLVGEHNVADPRLTTLSELFGLSALVGKTNAIIADAHLGSGDKALATLEIIKAISGEDSIEVHRKHLPSIPNARLRVRFTLGCNELPKFGDHASALLSRLLVLPYNVSFEGREDRHLEGKLAAEAPGVLNWALWGLKRLRTNGRFTVPQASLDTRDEFERLTNPIAAFIADCCKLAPDGQVARDEVFAAWQKWCTTNGHLAGSRDRFGTRLRMLVPRMGSARPRGEDGTRQYAYTGLVLV